MNPAEGSHECQPWLPCKCIDDESSPSSDSGTGTTRWTFSNSNRTELEAAWNVLSRPLLTGTTENSKHNDVNITTQFVSWVKDNSFCVTSAIHEHCLLRTLSFRYVWFLLKLKTVLQSTVQIVSISPARLIVFSHGFLNPISVVSYSCVNRWWVRSHAKALPITR